MRHFNLLLTVCIYVVLASFVFAHTTVSPYPKEVHDTPFLFAATFNSHVSNESLVQISVSNATYTKVNNAIPAALVESYSAIGFDSTDRVAYLYGISGESPFFDTYDVDTLSFTGTEVYLPSGSPVDIQFDDKLKLLVGVDTDDSGNVGVYAYNLKSAVRTLIVVLPNVEGVDESQTCVYDQSNHIYYVSVITPRGSSYYVVDVQAKKILKNLVVKDFVQNAVFDPLTNKLYGIYNISTFASLDLTSGSIQTFPSLNFGRVGFRELNTATYDAKNGIYYVLFENRQAKTTLILVDVRKQTFETFNFYDHIGVMQFIPAEER